MSVMIHFIKLSVVVVVTVCLSNLWTRCCHNSADFNKLYSSLVGQLILKNLPSSRVSARHNYNKRTLDRGALMMNLDLQ